MLEQPSTNMSNNFQYNHGYEKNRQSQQQVATTAYHVQNNDTNQYELAAFYQQQKMALLPPQIENGSFVGHDPQAYQQQNQRTLLYYDANQDSRGTVEQLTLDQQNSFSELSAQDMYYQYQHQLGFASYQPMFEKPPLHIDIHKRPAPQETVPEVVQLKDNLKEAGHSNKCELPKNGNAPGREPFYSQKNGIDVTKIIRQTKESILQKRIDEQRNLRNAQIIPRQEDTDTGRVALTSPLMGARNVNLQTTLNITQKVKPTMTTIEEDQLKAGLHTVLEKIIFPESEIQQQQEALSPDTVRVEPLNINFEHPGTPISPLNASKRRSLVLPLGQEVTEKKPSQTSIQTKRKFLIERTQIIYDFLKDIERQQLLQIFNQVPISNSTYQHVIEFIQEKQEAMKNKLQNDELLLIKEDLKKNSIKSNKFQTVFNSSEMFTKPHQSINSQNITSYLGNVPMQEPPYTLSYQRERRERQQNHMKNREFYTSVGLKKLSSPLNSTSVRNKRITSQENLPQVVQSVYPVQPSQKIRLRTQQNGNGRIQARKLLQLNNNMRVSGRQDNNKTVPSEQGSKNWRYKSPREGHQVLSPHLSFRKQNDDSRNIKSLNNSIDHTQEDIDGGRSIFSAPRDSVSHFRLGSNLLFAQKQQQTTKDASSKRIQNKNKSIKQKTGNSRNKSLNLNKQFKSQIQTDPKFNHHATNEDSLFDQGEKQPHQPRGNQVSIHPSVNNNNNSIVDYQEIDKDSILEVDLIQQQSIEGSRIGEIPLKNQNMNLADQFSKFVSQSLDHHVKVEESCELSSLMPQSYQQQYSTTREDDQFSVSSARKKGPPSNSVHISGQLAQGKIQLLKEYYKQLQTDQRNFDDSFEESTMNEEAFLSLVQKRDHCLEQVFYKSFKNGPVANSLNLPPIVSDILTALMDGYKSTILAFGKYEKRQKKVSDYKIERLTKVNSDILKEMNSMKKYDAFLQEKLKNVKGEMIKIELDIKRFFADSLMGKNREIIEEKFSDVTSALEQIQYDLSQQRVDLERNDADTNPSGKKKSTGLNQIEVMPFSKIKNQIDSNYSEIQFETTKAIVARLGLGQKIKKEDAEMNTEGEFVQKELYTEIDHKLFETDQKLTEMENQCKKLLTVVQKGNENIEVLSLSKEKTQEQVRLLADQEILLKKEVADLKETVDDCDYKLNKELDKTATLEKEVNRLKRENLLAKQQKKEKIEECNEHQTQATLVKEQYEAVVEQVQETKEQVAVLQVIEKEHLELKEQYNSQIETTVRLEQESTQLRDEMFALMAQFGQLKVPAKKTIATSPLRQHKVEDKGEKPWNQTEEKALRKAVITFGEGNWSRVADSINQGVKKSSEFSSLKSIHVEEKIYRTEDQCHDHYEKLKRLKLKRSLSKEEEEEPATIIKPKTDSFLIDHVGQDDVTKSVEIPKKTQKIISSNSLEREDVSEKMKLSYSSQNNSVQNSIQLDDDGQIKEDDDYSQVRKKATKTPIIVKVEKSNKSLTSSVVSSEEQWDQVTVPPIDVRQMRQQLKRQATLCPAHPMPNHKDTQTEISGPIMHMQQSFGLSGSDEKSHGAHNYQRQNEIEKDYDPTIYQFAYDKMYQTQNDGGPKTPDKPRIKVRDSLKIKESKIVKTDKKILSNRKGKIMKGSVWKDGNFSNSGQDLGILGMSNVLGQVGQTAQLVALKINTHNKQKPVGQQSINSGQKSRQGLVHSPVSGKRKTISIIDDITTRLSQTVVLQAKKKMKKAQHPTNEQAAAGEASINLNVPIGNISGLSQQTLPMQQEYCSSFNLPKNKQSTNMDVLSENHLQKFDSMMPLAAEQRKSIRVNMKKRKSNHHHHSKSNSLSGSPSKK